jgi:hypothetical protein
MSDLTIYDSDEFIEGPELSYEMWVARQIGPRKVGGRYRSHYGDAVYEVLAIEPGPRSTWPTWQITVRGEGGQIRSHCTAWDERDQVVTEPGQAALTVWTDTGLTQPAADTGALMEQRHVLDEAAHPDLVEAFRRLAPA